MQFKLGVDLSIAPVMAKVLPHIDNAYREVCGHDATVTSGKDGKHMVGSLHYVGLALDLRTRDVPTEKLSALRAALRRELNGAGDKDVPYNVVAESDHIHLEYDPS